MVRDEIKHLSNLNDGCHQWAKLQMAGQSQLTNESRSTKLEYSYFTTPHPKEKKNPETWLAQ